ncbi:MAG TPA: glycosyltransferase family 4 protein [Candidatus Paceibacterota bacterium]|nr:glycosyltransferase family 4 protein [Candidatus Paceibacterota bacterium]
MSKTSSKKKIKRALEKRAPAKKTFQKQSPLRIAQIAPVVERVPPKRYGGTERVVSALTEELVRRGHDVTLFASGDSITAAKLVPVIPRSLREAKPELAGMSGVDPAAFANIGNCYAQQDKFDIIHDHEGHISLPTANIAKTPVVMTLHGPFTPENRMIFEKLSRPYFVTISNAQARPVPRVRIAANIYNGLPMESYPFEEQDDGYLLFVGRISPEKGTHFAIEVAQFLDIPLVIAAKLDAADRSYFKNYIEPTLSSELVSWVGEVGEEERNKLMSRALCMLHPVTWREPFGLAMIEAMACGCPVVGFNRGSVPELVVNGKTGFVANDFEEMAEAILRIKEIKRAACRAHALKNFSAPRMADDYEKLFYRILGEKKTKK